VPRVGRAPTWKQTWRDIAVIHRLEYPLPITYLCYAGWGACFAVGDIRRLLDAVVLLAIAANALIILAALALNNAVDIRTDRRHRDKGYLASAVLRFGRARTFRWAAAETAAGLASAVAVSLWTGRWIVTGIATATVVLHLLYNTEPVHLKRRGLTGSAVFGTALVGLPFLLAYCAVQSSFPASGWLIVGGLSVLAVGRTAWWSVPDQAADTVTGIATPPVRYGAVCALALSCLILLAGLGLLGWGLWWRYGAGWVIPGIAAHGVFLAGVLIFLFGAISNRDLPSSVSMRSRAMPLVMIGEVALAVVPLVAD
jgi:lycopene elongase/hydratase (dihydrobisanhydrobacterioruberin-forming)